jgi:SAM-dependent methyltransferase
MFSVEKINEMFKIPQENHPERLFVLDQIKNIEKEIAVSVDKMKILDVGCGRHKTHSSFIGVDIEMVSDICESMDNLPFDNETVDVIISRHSLEHSIDPVKTIIEWKRILSRNGHIIIVLPDHEKIDTMQQILSNGCHLHAYTMESIKNLIGLFGLSIELLCPVVDGWSFGCVIKKI